MPRSGQVGGRFAQANAAPTAGARPTNRIKPHSRHARNHGSWCCAST